MPLGAPNTGSVGSTFPLQPTLLGRFVHLRPLRADDFERLYAVASDPLIWEQHPESTRHQRDVFRKFCDGAMASGGAFLVTDAAMGAVIGSSRYHAYNEAQRSVEIGWTFLARSHWGGDYNGEMKRLMLRHAFQFVDRVEFIIGIANTRSWRAIERIGAVFAGERPGNAGNPSVVYVVTKESFAD